MAVGAGGRGDGDGRPCADAFWLVVPIRGHRRSLYPCMERQVCLASTVYVCNTCFPAFRRAI